MTPTRHERRMAAIFVASLEVLELAVPMDETEKKEGKESAISRRGERHGPRKDKSTLHPTSKRRMRGEGHTRVHRAL